MKYSTSMAVYGRVFSGFLSGKGWDRKAILAEYREILKRAKPIAVKGNPLISSYAMCAFFIAAVRCTGDRTAEEVYGNFAQGFQKSRLIRMAMGDAEGYLNPKRMKGRLEWAERTHQRRYENDWVVNVLPATEEYDLGYDYLECGDCKLCRDEGCPELAPMLCRLDFVMMDMMGLHLDRTTTLAEGGEKCDFRFRRRREGE